MEREREKERPWGRIRRIIRIPNEGDRLARDSKMAAPFRENEKYVSSITVQKAMPCLLKERKKKKRRMDEPWPIWKGGNIYQWRIRNGPWPVSSDHDEHGWNGWIVKRCLDVAEWKMDDRLKRTKENGCWFLLLLLFFNTVSTLDNLLSKFFFFFFFFFFFSSSLSL